MMEPNQILDEIRRRSNGSWPLNVFWVSLSTGRDDFAERLKQIREGWPVVPWVLRTSGFSDPNSVMNDVIDVLHRARKDIEAVGEVAKRRGGVALVLLSRRELNLAVTSSPILLPDWFPVAPEQTVTARIDDLTWSVRVPISDEASLDDLRRILYEIDEALVARLQESLNTDHNRVQSFWSHVCRENDDKIAAELSKIRNGLQEIKNPTGYRPSTKNPTIVSRLWYTVNRTKPDGLAKTAKALAEALNVENDADHDDAPLLAVLNRPTNPVRSSRQWWSFCLIVALRSACQLVTAAAHADEYPRFPVVLLRSTSLDLQQFLDAAVGTLRRSTTVTRAR